MSIIFSDVIIILIIIFAKLPYKIFWFSDDELSEVLSEVSDDETESQRA